MRRLDGFASHTATYLDDLAARILRATQTPEYGVYMDVQQAINVALFERFAEEGIEFAYPTRTIHLATPDIRISKAAPPAEAPAP